MRVTIQTLMALMCSTGIVLAQEYPPSLPDVVAIQQGASQAHCTGVLISPDMIMTSEGCMVGLDITGPFTAIPGLNDNAELGAEMPLPREFIASHYSYGETGIGLAQIGRLPNRDLPSIYSVIPEAPVDLEVGASVDVVHYGGESSASQMVSYCDLSSLEEGEAVLSCNLPDEAEGAPAFFQGELVGIVTPKDGPGSRLLKLPYGKVEPQKSELGEISPFGSVDVLNLCNQDIHQGLFWLDADGQTWRELARRVPAQSRSFLPVETIGDRVFSYARSDDGRFEWSGNDIAVRIRNVDLRMKQLTMPKPTGDLTLIYECEK